MNEQGEQEVPGDGQLPDGTVRTIGGEGIAASFAPTEQEMALAQEVVPDANGRLTSEAEFYEDMLGRRDRFNKSGEKYNPNKAETIAFALGSERHPLKRDENSARDVYELDPEYFASLPTGEFMTVVNELNKLKKEAYVRQVLVARANSAIERVSQTVGQRDAKALFGEHDQESLLGLLDESDLADTDREEYYRLKRKAEEITRSVWGNSLQSTADAVSGFYEGGPKCGVPSWC